MLFRTLLRLPKTKLSCFQAIPNSFAKTPEVGVPRSLFVRTKMKLQNAKSAVLSVRCAHRDSTGFIVRGLLTRKYSRAAQEDLREHLNRICPPEH